MTGDNTGSDSIPYLPQYAASRAFMERFLDAIHEEGREIARSTGTRGQIKLVDGSEVAADSLNYFYENKSAMESEFYGELKDLIGQEKTEKVCKAIAQRLMQGRCAHCSEQKVGS